MSELRQALVDVVAQCHPYLKRGQVEATAAALEDLRCYALRDGRVIPTDNFAGLRQARFVDSTVVATIARAQAFGDDPAMRAIAEMRGRGVDPGCLETDSSSTTGRLFTDSELATIMDDDGGPDAA